MAGSERLTVRRGVRFAAVVAAVIAMHALLLDWAQRAFQGPPPLKTMVDPMFTRLLQPEAPPPIVENASPAPAAQQRTAIAAATVASRPRRAASKPKAPPAPPPELVASAPAPEPVPPALPALPVEAAQPPPAASSPEPAVASASAASSPAIAAASAASGPAIVIAAGWPADTRVWYKLTGYFRGDLVGDARVQWQRQGDRYQARVDLDVGLFRYSFLSQGEVTGDSLSPSAYQETSPNRTRIVQLGAENIVLNDGRSLPRPPFVQDTASQFVELGHRFATGKDRLVPGGVVPIWLARPGGVDQWFYDIVGREMLATPQLGTLETFHLKPRPIANARGNITAEIWFAPSLQYLPVRVRINVGTEAWADLMVDRIEQR